MVFQGKPWDEHNRKHLIIELGDVMWYVMQACMALDVSLDEVVEGNVDKLKKDILVESLMSTNQKTVRRETYEGTINQSTTCSCTR